MLNPHLIELEDRAGLGATYAAKLLGVAYPTYAAYRNCTRDLPEYHVKHVQALLLLSSSALNSLIREHVHAKK